MKKRLIRVNYRGQIWVETVIYVLIALVLIAAVIAFARPKIEELSDKKIIENNIDLLKDLDNLMVDMSNAAGNQRTPGVNIEKGFLEIRGVENQIYMEIDGSYKYSEPETTINHGGINITTIKIGDVYRIQMLKDYNGSYNITFTGKDINKRLGAANTEYKLIITNNGYNQTLGGVLLNFRVE